MEEENISSASSKNRFGHEHVNPVPASGEVETNNQLRSDPGSTASPSQGSESESEDDSLSPSPPPRPNKFSGPPSTWRTWTAAERQLAASLDQLRARDLAVHLYNAHALKRRARAIYKQRQKGGSEREVDGRAWMPPKAWTAWPLGPDEVPREGETKVWEDEADIGFRKRRRIVQPSDALRDAVVGEILRNATERFRLRQWEEEESPASLERSTKKKSRDEGNIGNEQPMRDYTEDNGGSEDKSHSEAKLEREIEASTDMESDTESDSRNEGNSRIKSESEDEINRGTRRMITRSQSSVARKSTTVQTKSESMTRSLSKNGKSQRTNLAPEVEDIDAMKPVLMADDEQAHEILQPTVHHILANLDHLLMGLHQARQAYLPGAYDSASETQTDAEELSEAESGNKRSRPGRSKYRPRGSKNKRSRDASMRYTKGSRSRSKSVASSNSGSDDVQNRSPVPRASSRKPRRRRSRSPESRARLLHKIQARLGLRDWSDVLGIASMTGWNPAVVTRAAGRCAALFEEGIMFRTLEEGMQGSDEVSILPKNLLPEEDSLGKNKPQAKQVESEDEMLGAVHLDGFLKHIQVKKSWKVRGS